MIKSMTGFGVADFSIEAARYKLEVKAVNGKFCDVKAKMPNNLYGFESNIQQQIRAKLGRGHIEVYIARDGFSSDAPTSVSINWDLAESYYKAYQSIRHKFGISQDVGLSMMTNAREVITFQRRETADESVWVEIESALDAALVSVIQMRETEGKSLAVDMAGRCDLIKKMSSEVAKLSPKVVETYKKRLEERIAAISPQEIDDARLAQEVCYFADRSDIAEELTRIKSHLQQFLHFLNAEEPVGRKLDFIIQELNREANTIGSKCNDAKIAQIVVEIKSELERLREQVQNVE